MMQHIRYPDFDTYTVGHSVRVAALAVYVGTTLNIAETTLLDLGTAGLLHDLGKSRIPEEILFKPGRFTAEEFGIMKEHAILGVEILRANNNTTAMDVAAARGHHIRFDGKGYPEPPMWAVRHPLTALLQICDVFEALTAIRPYKPPLGPAEAYAIMLGDEGAFHPAMLAHFMSVVGLYPPGNIVILSDGRKGMVTNVGPHIDRPEVEIEAEPTFRLDLNSVEHSDLYVTGLDLEY